MGVTVKTFPRPPIVIERLHVVTDLLMDNKKMTILPPLFPSKKPSKQISIFSVHDNRYTLRNVGESLGKGLGKRKLIDKDVDQHLSNDLISWREPSAKSMSSSKPTSLSMYQPFTDTSAILNTFTASNDLLSKYQIFTKGHFHRYPHKHNLVSNPSIVRPVPLTTDWGVDPVVTPFWVMATTQKPFITKNNWKYSYNRFR